MLKLFLHQIYFTFASYSKVSGGDTNVPSFIMHTMSELKLSIEEIVEKHLPDDNHFVVEVIIAEKAAKTTLNILIDSDEGVNIQTCADVSRAVSEELEAKDLMPGAYVLEVSSPGLEYPLNSRRQFQKNIGRELKVLLTTGNELVGKLVEVDTAGVKMLVKKKEKGKKATEEEVVLPFEEMKKTIVQVSFK